MKWNLRLAAANRGIWKASELQQMLADHALSISAGKMSGLRSGDPASIKLSGPARDRPHSVAIPITTRPSEPLGRFGAQ